MIVAIDGPAGTGKGTVAKLISQGLNFLYIDTGAMYRCITLKMFRNNVSIDDDEAINLILENTAISFKDINNKNHVIMDGEDVTELIRTVEVNNLVAKVSAIKIVRLKLVELQRTLGMNNNVVMEGRDITTVVFPNADIKIYLDADVNVRAQRRYKELVEKGSTISFEETLNSIIDRDNRDMNKELGALKIADDAIVIDTTYLSINEVYEKILSLIKERGLEC